MDDSRNMIVPSLNELLSQYESFITLIGNEINYIKLMILFNYEKIEFYIDDDYLDTFLCSKKSIDDIKCLSFNNWSDNLENIKVYLDKGKVVDVTIAVYAGSNCIVSDTSIDNLKSNYDTYCRFFSVA